MTEWTPERRQRQSEITKEWHRKRRKQGIDRMRGLKMVGMYLDDPSRRRLEALKGSMGELSRSSIVRRLIMEESERRRFGEVKTVTVPKDVFDWMVDEIAPLGWFGRKKAKMQKRLCIKDYYIVPNKKRRGK